MNKYTHFRTSANDLYRICNIQLLNGFRNRFTFLCTQIVCHKFSRAIKNRKIRRGGKRFESL